MREIRERLEEIQKLTRADFTDRLVVDALDEIHEDATKALALLGESEPVAHAVMADGYVLAANRNVALLESDRARLVRAFPKKDFAPGLVPLYTSPTPTSEREVFQAGFRRGLAEGPTPDPEGGEG